MKDEKLNKEIDKITKVHYDLRDIIEKPGDLSSNLLKAAAFLEKMLNSNAPVGELKMALITTKAFKEREELKAVRQKVLDREQQLLGK